MQSIFNFIVIVILIGCIVFSCEEENDVPQLTIQTGRECGWCAGTDSLYITEKFTFYEFQDPCDRQNDVARTIQTERAVWSDLVSSLDWETFSSININTCAYCADGCDTWISIEKNGNTHRIRFTNNSSEVAPLQGFIQKLQDWHDEVQ